MGNLNGKTWWRNEAPEPATVGADGTLGGAMAKVAQNNVDITMKTFFWTPTRRRSCGPAPTTCWHGWKVRTFSRPRREPSTTAHIMAA